MAKWGSGGVPLLSGVLADVAGGAGALSEYWRRWRSHVEIDGAHHMDARHWAADMRRQNDVWLSGDQVLRFPAWWMRTHPEGVADHLRKAFAAGTKG